ncbi:MAG TPA: DUF6249 domain-containing protein [Bacteroidota bacterium]|nr:DUF6249 domain-containing protein [Bacteroidota bacterium]
MEPILVVFIIFGSTGLIIWKWIETRHKERIAMIDKGVTPADFKGVSVREMFKTNPLSSLKWGLLALFVGAGLFLGSLLDQYMYLPDAVYPASMLVLGGLGLVIFYVIAARKMKSESM